MAGTITATQLRSNPRATTHHTRVEHGSHRAGAGEIPVERGVGVQVAGGDVLPDLKTDARVACQSHGFGPDFRGSAHRDEAVTAAMSGFPITPAAP
jgi:hypothetical protein